MRYALIIILFSSSLFAKKDKYYIDRDTAITSNIVWQFCSAIGFVNVSGSQDFYDDYRKNMNSSNTRFESQLSYELGVRFFVSENVRALVSGQYFQSKFSDDYFEPFSVNSESGRRLNQSIILDEVPITLNLELVPYSRSQFRTYFGIGTGVSIGDYKWTENVGSDVILDPRETGERFNESYISPIIKFILGTELNFDKFGRNTFLGSLYVESNFSYIYRNVNLFSGFKQLDEFILSENINYDKNYNLNNISLQIKIGVTVNFYKNRGKANGN